MPLSSYFPAIAVEIGFTAAPFDALSSVTWTNVTSAISHINVKRGRSNERSTFEGGTASLTVHRAAAKDFVPTNTSSIYAPNVKPMVRVRISATWSGTTYRVFTGYIWNFHATWSDPAVVEVTLECADAFRLLNLYALPPTPWGMQVLKDRPKAWYRLSEGMGTAVVNDSSGNNLNGNYQGNPALGMPGLFIGDSSTGFAPVRSQFGTQSASLPYKSLITGYPFTIEFWMRSATDRAAGKNVLDVTDGPASYKQEIQVAITDNNGFGSGARPGAVWFWVANGASTGFQQTTITVDDSVTHHIVCVALADRHLKIYVDGVDRSDLNSLGGTFPDTNLLLTGYSLGQAATTALGDYAFATQPTDSMQDVVIYDGLALSAARISAHYATGASWDNDRAGARIARLLDDGLAANSWPSADRALDVGGSQMQPASLGGSALSSIQQVADSDLGAFFVSADGKMTFVDRYHYITPPNNTSTATFSTTAKIFELPLDLDEDDMHVVNDATVTRNNGTPQVVRDSTSQAAIGPRSYSKSLPDLRFDSDALYAAQAIVFQNKTVQPRVGTLRVKPHDSAAILYPVVLGSELLSRFTLVTTPPGCASNTMAVQLESLTHDITPGELWTTEYGLSQSDTNTYWILGTAALGTDTRLGV